MPRSPLYRSYWVTSVSRTSLIARDAVKVQDRWKMLECIITARGSGTARDVDYPPIPVSFVKRGSKGCLWLVLSVAMEVIKLACGAFIVCYLSLDVRGY